MAQDIVTLLNIKKKTNTSESLWNVSHRNKNYINGKISVRNTSFSCYTFA